MTNMVTGGQLVTALLGVAVVAPLLYGIDRLLYGDLAKGADAMEVLAVASLLGAFYCGKLVRLVKELFNPEPRQPSTPPRIFKRSTPHEHKWLTVGDVCLVFTIVVVSLSILGAEKRWLEPPVGPSQIPTTVPGPGPNK